MNLFPRQVHKEASDLDDHTSSLARLNSSALEQQQELSAYQHALEDRLCWLEAIIDNVPASLYVKDMQGRFILSNRRMSEIFGGDALDELIGRTDFDLHSGEPTETFFGNEQDAISSGKAQQGIEREITDADGRRRWMLISKSPIRSADGALAGIVGLSFDISDRKETETLMLAQASMFGMVARSLPLEEIVSSIILLVEAQLPGTIASVQMLSPDGLCLLDPIAPNLPRNFRASITGMSFDHEAASCSGAQSSAEMLVIEDILEYPLWKELGDTAVAAGIRSYWSTPILSYQSVVLGTFSVYTSYVAAPTSLQSDVMAMASYMFGFAVERRQSEERIRFMAHHDALTGLPNRLMFDERLTCILEEARENGGRVTLAFLDLDNFKLINDSLGHDAGDQLLKTIADRARRSIGKSDLIARLGGDEFVILLCDPSPGEAAGIDRLQQLRTATSEPIVLSGRSLQVTFSMGVACFPEHGETSAVLLGNADLAMYRAKACGRNNIKTFALDMAEVSNAKLFQYQQLRDAISGHQFVIHYQPQIDLRSGRIFAVEALVRWNHPDRGLVPPAEFIPLAEETGLIIAIGDWVLKTACLQNKAWQDAGCAPVVVSVNVSARQFGEKHFERRVAKVLEETNLQACYLELELTESLIMQDLRKAKTTMNELNALGVRLAIDDFGTGYSSLSALKSFPVDKLKIDRSFVQDIPVDEDDMAITSAIIALAQTLGLDVIAEGVETQAQVDFLRRSGCNEVQGYFFSRPITSKQCALLLKRAHDCTGGL